MFGWIGRIWQWGVSNVGDPVASWVHDFVRGIFGWLATLFGHIGEAWHAVFTVGVLLFHAAEAFGHAIWEEFYRLFVIALPRLIRWAGHELTLLGHAIRALYNRLVRDVINLYHHIAHAISGAIHWVVTHVYDPLKRDIVQAWDWITKRGELVFYYMTHPDKLAMLIFDSLLELLEREAWTVGRKLGRFFLSLVVHNLRQFVLLIEDIVMAVF